MKKIANDLKTVAKQLNTLAKKTENMAKAFEKPSKKAAPKKKRYRPRKKRPHQREKPSPPRIKVLTIMKRFKKGITVEALRGKSGFTEKQISNIVHRACKKGKMKRADGVFTLYINL
jgi:hypothetical protein